MQEKVNCIAGYHFATQQNFPWLGANFNILQEKQREGTLEQLINFARHFVKYCFSNAGGLNGETRSQMY